jgi:heme-degrading monooxygenase HmoA
MFARLVEATAKPGKRDEITTILTSDILPLLKKQQGFVDAVGLSGDTSPDEGVTLIFWTTKDDAEKFYATQEFKSKILDRMTPLLVEGMKVRTFNVETSTFHKIAASKAA